VATLQNARDFLSRYAGQGNSFTERLNFVIARLLPEGNWRETKVPMRFAVYEDSRGNKFITTPRGIETILAGAYQAPSPDVQGPNWYWCGNPLPIRNDWYEMSPSGPGNLIGANAQMGIIALPGRFTTFCDWSDAMRLRIKLEQTEVAGNILIKGELAGEKIYTQDGSNWIEGLSVNFTNATVTTTQLFDQPPYQIVKSVTKGRVRLYKVDNDDNETLVGFYDPNETDPSYRRFKVPTCDTTGP